ncbi:MAG: 2-oxoacid:acceptor oxidoreductase family protein [Acutalibacteraceae bacterium]
MSNLRLVTAGFGGQGVLFIGKVAAYAGMIDDMHISWIPSYGPEMRGGTANCSVCISEKNISSPLVPNPDVLIALNNPSLEKFCGSVKPNGLIISDTNIVTMTSGRNDIEEFGVRATEIAEQNGVKGLSNMIVLGILYAKTNFCTEKALFEAIRLCTPKRKSEMLEFNNKAVKVGISLV